MPTKHPRINVVLPEALYKAVIERAGGKQKASDYIRSLAEKDLGMTISVHHGRARSTAAGFHPMFDDLPKFVALWAEEPRDDNDFTLVPWEAFKDGEIEQYRVSGTIVLRKPRDPVEVAIMCVDVPVRLMTDPAFQLAREAFLELKDGLL